MSELEERGNELVSHISRLFTEHTDAPESAVRELEDTFGEYVDNVSRLEETTTQTREMADELESSHEITQESLWRLEDCVLGEYDSVNGRFEEQSVVDQVDEMESRIEENKEHATDIEAQTPPIRDGKTPLQNTLLAESPLEQVTGLTDKDANEHLSANQIRARNIAMDIPVIAKDTPSGYVISSNQLRSEITVMKGKAANDNDVKRVWEFLDDLGKDHVDVIDHRGSKKVVIEKKYARNLGRESYAPDECLVVEHKNSWRDMLGLHTSGKDDTNASVAV